MCSQMHAMEAASARARNKMGKRSGKQAFSRRGFLEGASAMAGAAASSSAVPAHERHLFAKVEDFWKSRRIFELYSVQNNLFSLTRNMPVEGALRD